MRWLDIDDGDGVYHDVPPDDPVAPWVPVGEVLEDFELCEFDTASVSVSGPRSLNIDIFRGGNPNPWRSVTVAADATSVFPSGGPVQQISDISSYRLSFPA